MGLATDGVTFVVFQVNCQFTEHGRLWIFPFSRAMVVNVIAPGQWYTYQGTTLDQTHKTPVCIPLLRCKLLDERLPAAQITQAARWSGHQPSADDPWGHPSSGNHEWTDHAKCLRAKHLPLPADFASLSLTTNGLAQSVWCNPNVSWVALPSHSIWHNQLLSRAFPSKDDWWAAAIPDLFNFFLPICWWKMASFYEVVAIDLAQAKGDWRS